MGYLSDWKAAEDASREARAANPNCDLSETCPAPDDGHLVGCRANRRRLGLPGTGTWEAQWRAMLEDRGYTLRSCHYDPAYGWTVLVADDQGQEFEYEARTTTAVRRWIMRLQPVGQAHG